MKHNPINNNPKMLPTANRAILAAVVSGRGEGFPAGSIGLLLAITIFNIFRQ
jgi:hypothetical protein